MICAWCGARDHDRGEECPRMRKRKGSQDAPGQGDWVWLEPPQRCEQYRFTHEADYEAALKEEADIARKQKEAMERAEKARAEGPREVLKAIRESPGLVAMGRRVLSGGKRR